VIVPIRKHALVALVKALEDACPTLRGKITSHADRDEKMTYPKCGIRVVRAPLKRYQRRKVARVGGATIWDCGHFEALVQLRLGCSTDAQRTQLGEQLVGAFLGDGSAAGALVTHVPEVPSLEEGVPGATACWELDEDGWQDEMAFSQRWWQTLVITGMIPALVRVEGPLVETVRLDFEDGVAAAETVFVLEDGSISETSPLE
jgi:hypothetical protein